MNSVSFLTSIALALSPFCLASTFDVAGDRFHLDGQAFQTRSGEMHYPRIPMEEWDERVGMAKAVGLLEPLSVAEGGPVLMVQVENEFGHFGTRDPEYLRAMEQALRSGGHRGLLFTGDGATEAYQQRGGTKDLLKAVNFAGEAKSAFATLAAVQPGKPRFTTEFWVGWFDQWGRPHHDIEAREKALDLKWMMAEGISFNLYMFHGGTTRGFWSGANWDGSYRPTAGSSDYSAPLDESGRPTAKYDAFREIIGRKIGMDRLPAVPAGSIGTLSLGEELPLLDGQRIGIGGRSGGNAPVPVKAGPGKHRLDLLVENMGRINCGQVMNTERGIPEAGRGWRERGVVRFDLPPLEVQDPRTAGHLT